MTSEPSSIERKRGGLKSDQLSGLMLLALALYVGWENRAYPVGTLQEPGPGYMPLILVVFLGATGLLIALWGAKSAPLASMNWTEAARAVVILVACGVATFALERIGYRLTVIALLIFFLGVIERKRPLPVALVAAGFSFASFYIVGDLLHVPLPRSPWGF
ncbi:MAG: tripartite tricarboxylate transporter TctB family protein [Betaproteobacteria bacterium]|nr:tripartite tricarboxylate transporter TctB family protein [Betaproteobacteria bacterium]